MSEKRQGKKPKKKKETKEKKGPLGPAPLCPPPWPISLKHSSPTSRRSSSASAAQLELLLVALLCQGHVLIEDVPGTGKTMLARAAAGSLGLSYKRVQCTPDLLPNDITGVNVFNQQTGGFDFRPGPVFVNILLADEINRATPRTQAALLEAMQERQVTVDGVTHPVGAPFIVLATQNPVEFEGTFPLPEAQLDRFLMRLSLGYPGPEDEIQIVRNQRKRHPIETIEPVAGGDELLALSEPGQRRARGRDPGALLPGPGARHAHAPRCGAGRQHTRHPGAVQDGPGAGRAARPRLRGARRRSRPWCR